MLMAAPATGHVGGTVAHLVGHLKNFFYTKSQSNARYLPSTGNLRPGKTLRGTFAFANDAGGAGEIGTDAISFPVRLPSVPLVRIIDVGAPAPAECPGTVALPRAKPGYLCIFVAYKNNVGGFSTINPEDVFGGQPSAGRTGAWIYSNSAGAGRQQTTGTWAVTARATTPSPRPVLTRPTSGSPTG
jgi:hypothetical protein